MTLPVELLHNYLIIEEQIDPIKTTKGGLMLSQKHREDIRFRKAKVIKIGPQVSHTSVGDLIHFDYRGAQELLYPLEGYKIITEQHVMLIEDEKKHP